MSEFIKMKLSEARAKFEQIDEVSDDVLRSYTNKVTMGVDPKSGTRNPNDIRTLKKKAKANATLGNDQEASRLNSKAKTRQQGLTKAFARMGGVAAPGSPVDKARKKIPSSYLNREEAGLTEAAAIMKHFHGEDGDHDGSPNRAEWDHDTIVKHLANTIGTTHPVYKSIKADLKKATAFHHKADRHYDNPDKHMDYKDQAHDYEEGAKEKYANHLKLARTHKEETGLTEGANGMFAAKDNGSYPAHHDHITHDTYGDSGHEATGAQHKFAATHPPVHTFQHEGSTHKIFHHPNGSTIHTMEHTHGYHGDDIAVYSGHHDPKHIEKQEKKYGGMNESACMTNTSMGGADQIAQSKVGEIYKNPRKSGDAMNATAINRRVPAVESAVLDVMAKTFEKRKMFEDASNIAIISPEQRQDWLNVSTGSMEVVDYFNKYKV